MKVKSGLLILLTAFISTIPVFGDEVGIYKGSESSKYTAQGQSTAFRFPEYLVIDYTSHQYQEIFLTNGKQKQFTTGSATAIDIIRPVDDRGKTAKNYTVLIFAKTTPNAMFAGSPSNSTEYRTVYLRALDVSMVLGGSTRLFPKILGGTLIDAFSDGMITSGPDQGSLVAAGTVETHGMWTLQKPLTSDAITNNDTLAQAVQAVKTLLLSLHYVDGD